MLRNISCLLCYMRGWKSHCGKEKKRSKTSKLPSLMLSNNSVAGMLHHTSELSIPLLHLTTQSYHPTIYTHTTHSFNPTQTALILSIQFPKLEKWIYCSSTHTLIPTLKEPTHTRVRKCTATSQSNAEHTLTQFICKNPPQHRTKELRKAAMTKKLTIRKDKQDEGK